MRSIICAITRRGHFKKDLSRTTTVMSIRLRVFHPHSGAREQQFEVGSVEEAKRQAQDAGLLVLSTQSKQRRALRRGTRFPLLLFNTELLALLKAGLNIVEAMEALTRRERTTSARPVLEELKRRLEEGMPFSNALATQPALFPELYVAAIRASERTGNIQEALERFLDYRQQMDRMKKKLVSSALYPSLIIVVGLLVMLFLLTYVLPRFSQVYIEQGDALPLATRWLIAWGTLVAEHGLLVFGAFAASLALLASWLMRPATRALVMRLLWRLPTVGERLRLYQLARFYRTMSMLLSGGIPLVQALKMAARLLPQPALAAGLAGATREIEEGRAVTAAMDKHGLTDDIAARLLQAGERNGELGGMMERIANFYDEDMANWLDWASRLFEPLLMTVVGALVGAVVLLMYMPIFDLAGSLQ